MKKNRFRIITTNCRRCGKQIATGNRSLFGADTLKAEYDSICEECISPEERHQMEEKMGQAVVQRLTNA